MISMQELMMHNCHSKALADTYIVTRFSDSTNDPYKVNSDIDEKISPKINQVLTNSVNMTDFP